MASDERSKLDGLGETRGPQAFQAGNLDTSPQESSPAIMSSEAHASRDKGKEKVDEDKAGETATGPDSR